MRPRFSLFFLATLGALAAGCFESHSLPVIGLDAGPAPTSIDAGPLPDAGAPVTIFDAGPPPAPPTGCVDRGPLPACDTAAECDRTRCIRGQCCVGPYRVVTPDNRCVWSCGRGTRPCASECVCQPGLTESGTDTFGRRTCD